MSRFPPTLPAAGKQSCKFTPAAGNCGLYECAAYTVIRPVPVLLTRLCGQETVKTDEEREAV